MNSNVIQFACSHCQSWLTVPAHLAGVAGPCPKCGQHIVSPRSSESAPPVQAPAPAPLPPSNPGPQWSPAPARPATGGLGMGAPAPSYTPPSADSGWGIPPVVPGAPLPVMPSVPMGGDPGYGRSSTPAASPPIQPPAPAWGGHPAPAEVPIQGPQGSGYMPGSTQGQPSLLRPQPGPHGPPASPPQMPSNAIADAMRNLPPGMPGQPGQMQPQAPLTRPATIGGSRLSLLARQLTTSADGSSNLPPSPEPMHHADNGGRDAYGRASAPEPQRQAMGATMNFQQAPPSSAQPLPYPRQKRGGSGKLAAVALLVAMGAGAYHYQDQLREIWERTMPPEPGLPSTVDTPIESPTPGVDPDPQATPRAAEPAPEPQYTSPFPTTPAAPLEPKPLTPEPVPPRALPVTDSMASAPPAETIVSEPAPTTQPPVPPPPAMGVQTSRTPDRGMVASSASASLVEVGRAKDDPTVLPKMDSTPMMGNSDRPIIKNVPPVCNAAVQGLKKFLAASNWRERMKYVQLADQMQRKAEIYYATNQDGPVMVDEIRYLRHDIDPQIGKGMHVVFELASRSWNYTVPVMVEQINDETRVDWLTFVEFKDDLLNKFTSNYMDGPVRFHVGIRRSHYFEDDVPNADQKDVFEVTTPMENVTTYVFTPKGTPLARSLASTLSWDKEMSWVVVELQWRREGTHKWIELTALPQLNWYSDGSTPESVSAPSSAVAVPGAAAP